LTDTGGVLRTTLIGVVMAMLLTTLGAASAAAGRATTRVSASSPAALLAEINVVRAAHHLAPVTANDALAQAAGAHTRDMVARGYFLHESGPGGESFDARVHRFFRPARPARLGEVLAWGSGSYASAPSAVQRWLASPPHRAVLLSPSFREIGIGVAHGRFLGVSGAAVWTADFAR
jgi:uncharacterized protein YkwD